MNGSARADVLRGTTGNDWIDGGDGDDRIDALGGNDLVFGGAGRDTLNGGSGSDYVDGGTGDDLLVYAMGENKGSFDIYNGWTGADTLRLQFTAAEWARGDVKADVARFLAYLPEYNEPLGWIDDPVFTFKAFGLSVVGVNRLEVVVDGKVVNAADAPVVVKKDVATVGEDAVAGVTVDVLANDWVADGVKSVSIAQPANGKVELVSTDFASDDPSALIRFVPGKKHQALAEGQTAVEVFTYTVTDKDGDKKTASVEVTVVGANDAPTLTARTFKLDENTGVMTGTVAGKDVDAGAVLTYSATTDFFDRFTLYEDGTFEYNADHWSADELKAGETRVDTYDVTVTDEHGASSTVTYSFTVVGKNDAPEVQDTVQYMYEYDMDDPDDDGRGVFATATTTGRTGSIQVVDPDGEGPFTATVTKAAGTRGTLSVAWQDDGQGGMELGYRYEVDKAWFRGLAEDQKVNEVFTVTVKDPGGATETFSFTMELTGDGEDAPEPYSDPTADYRYEGDEMIGVAWIGFNDSDPNQTHTVSVQALGEGYRGRIEVGAIEGGSDAPFDTYRPYDFGVALVAPTAGIADLTPDKLVQAYKITVTDSTGLSGSTVQAFKLRDDRFYYGAEGDDLLEGVDYLRNVIVGEGGRDRLVGGFDRDMLFGDAGMALPDYQENDWRVIGWSPRAGVDDELVGGGGADTMAGGAGGDRFVIKPGEGEGDVITDFSAAAGDRLVLLDWGADATFRHLGGGKWEAANADRSVVEVMTLTGVTSLPAAAWAFQATPPTYSIGTAESEVIYSPYSAYNKSNVMVGGGGRDELIGGNRADQIYGDQGPALPADVVNELDAFPNDREDDGRDDVLQGGRGADTLHGGAGADTFVFFPGDAQGDVLLDFNRAEGDLLEFRYFGDGATFTKLDATHWEVANADRSIVEVVTFTNAPDIRPGDYLFL